MNKRNILTWLEAMLWVIPRSIGYACLIAMVTGIKHEQLWWTTLVVYIFMVDYMYDYLKLQQQINDLVKNKEDKKPEKQ
jgi:hypothetical protein